MVFCDVTCQLVHKKEDRKLNVHTNNCVQHRHYVYHEATVSGL